MSNVIASIAMLNALETDILAITKQRDNARNKAKEYGQLADELDAQVKAMDKQYGDMMEALTAPDGVVSPAPVVIPPTVNVPSVAQSASIAPPTVKTEVKNWGSAYIQYLRRLCREKGLQDSGDTQQVYTRLTNKGIQPLDRTTFELREGKTDVVHTPKKQTETAKPTTQTAKPMEQASKPSPQTSAKSAFFPHGLGEAKKETPPTVVVAPKQQTETAAPKKLQPHKSPLFMSESDLSELEAMVRKYGKELVAKMVASV